MPCTVGGQVTPIDVLPDDVLLSIFDFYLNELLLPVIRDMEDWQSLVHVCRRWRCVVFGSPRRLNLRLVCEPGTPARETLDVWPALPLVIDIDGDYFSTSADEIVFALGYRDRICRIDLREVTRGLEWDKVLAAMQVPFPALTNLRLRCRRDGPDLSILPDTFLGGSAPRLQYLDIYCIPFPGIPNLLLSATHLVDFDLSDIPHSGYISPEAMITCLSVLTSLVNLSLGFLSLRSRGDGESRRSPPMTRLILPDLNTFWFKGAIEYLESLVARIDAVRLRHLYITFPDQMNFDTPYLVQFISRIPRFEEPDEAHVTLDDDAEVGLIWRSEDVDERLSVSVQIYRERSDPQVSAITQVCSKCLPPLPAVENLRLGVFIKSVYSELDWKDDIEDDQWLELLRPFTSVKSLYLSEEFQPNIASALQELVGGRTTEVLPSLQNIFLEKFEPSGAFQEAIGQFVAARQLSGHPIAVLPLSLVPKCQWSPYSFC